jgi:hypothetical protein
MLKRVNIGVAKRVVLSPRLTGLAHPCGEELMRKVGGTQAGKFAEQIELAFSDEVERIRYREMITDVLISNSVFFNMMHVDAKDATNRCVIERGDTSADELGSEGPRFSAVKRCIGRDSKKHEAFGPGVSIGTEEGAEGCYLSFGLSQSVVNIGNVLEVGGDPGAQVLELVSEGDIILILITIDDISGGGSACSSGEGSSREEHCFGF